MDELSAIEVVETIAGLQKEPWMGKRDKAVILLLYGCGLRIGEALGLNLEQTSVLNEDTESIIVTGKGNKQRLVPVLPVINDAIGDYIKACPHELASNGPLFVGKRGKRWWRRPAHYSRTVGSCITFYYPTLY
jgi:integrase/recombinase XerC